MASQDMTGASHQKNSGLPSGSTPTCRGDGPILTLEVTSGKTRFPARPVHKERFTLGSGSRCDLRLGGDRIPLLHSVIIAGFEEILLERIAPAPSLIVNGQLVNGCVLRNGDVIRIGGIELQVTIPAPAPAELPDPLLAPVDVTLTEAELTGVDPNLSAAELVERVAETLAEFERYGERLNQGAEALLEEIQRRSGPKSVHRADGAHQDTGGPHWNLARIPIERVLATAGNVASEKNDLLRKIEGLEEEVARVSRQLTSLESSRDSSTASSAARATDLRRVKASLLAELNSLFDRLDTSAPAPRRATA